jgi:hypothetical protein
MRTKVPTTAPAKAKEPKKPPIANSGKNSGKKRPGRVENLKPFKPGQSGNPSGRPRNPISDAARRLASQRVMKDKEKRTWAEIMVLGVAEQAAKGNVQAFAVLADRIEGKVASKMELGGPSGGAIPITQMTPEENEKRILELSAKWAAKRGMKIVPLSEG